ncbi:MBL fold metallo-hydrolase [Mycobacterium sp. GA-2829]|uniref:MBL fold metallo-hydrolase n=1 Tax=Mycobacterium sp. GA-2829 TaxID=1772283 RepID=UPI00073FD0A5|nr:MBL fold metallo-hydrolase [Mycobacterium sp. GA-2829]KUI29290.1 hypothetical protein AU194_20675 [Mycobacterium sp. GA-2829]
MTVDRIDYVDDARIGTVPDVLLQPPPSAPDGWATSPPWFDEAGWVLPMGGFLLREEGRTILVDAGLGPYVPDDIGDQVGVPVRHEHSGRLLTSLAELDVALEDVTDVVLTHLHGDHVGWVAPAGTPVFTKARHHCHRADFDWLSAVGDTNPVMAGVETAVRTVSDLLVLADGDRTELTSSIALRLFAGHTPGNCIVDVSTGQGPVLLLGDTAHHPVLLVEEDWFDNLDEDRDEAARARARIAEEIVRRDAVGIGAHFPGGRGGRIVVDSNGERRWMPVENTALSEEQEGTQE